MYSSLEADTVDTQLKQMRTPKGVRLLNVSKMTASRTPLLTAKEAIGLNVTVYGSPKIVPRSGKETFVPRLS